MSGTAEVRVRPLLTWTVGVTITMIGLGLMLWNGLSGIGAILPMYVAAPATLIMSVMLLVRSVRHRSRAGIVTAILCLVAVSASTYPLSPVFSCPIDSTC